MVQTCKVSEINENTQLLLTQSCNVLYLYRTIQVEDLDWDKKFHQMAKLSSGFSGREIAKLAVSWQVLGHHVCVYITTVCL